MEHTTIPELHYPEASSLGLGLSYDVYDQFPTSYQSAASIRSRTGSPFMGHHTPSSHHSDAGIRTRSGRATRKRADSPHSSIIKKSPSPRAAKKNDKKGKTPKITAPLSQLTQDMTDVPVRDMQAWVNRPAVDRLEEAKKRKGYITRPMNSFMLYRSAYAERTKAWCAENNHQVVSSVSGESWPMEPQEVRDFYNELAKIERHNHQTAHPDYKFSPAKPGNAGRKRKTTDETSEEEFSDGDPDAEWGPPSKRAKSKKQGRDAGYPARNMATVGISYDSPEAEVYLREAIGYSRPAAVSSMPQPNYAHFQYYQPVVTHPYVVHPVDERGYHPMETHAYPIPAFYGDVPGHTHNELQHLHSQMSTPPPLGLPVEPQVDPLLLDPHYAAYEHTFAAEDHHAYTHHQPVHYPDPEPFGVPAIPASRPQQPQRHSKEDLTRLVTATPTTYHPEGFAPESTSPAFEGPSEFDRFWEEADFGGVGGRRGSVALGEVRAKMVSPKSKG